jgi:hypothetical protein
LRQACVPAAYFDGSGFLPPLLDREMQFNENVFAVGGLVCSGSLGEVRVGFGSEGSGSLSAVPT